mgnify:CR=1 FL=1
MPSGDPAPLCGWTDHVHVLELGQELFDTLLAEMGKEGPNLGIQELWMLQHPADEILRTGWNRNTRLLTPQKVGVTAPDDPKPLGLQLNFFGRRTLGQIIRAPRSLMILRPRGVSPTMIVIH